MIRYIDARTQDVSPKTDLHFFIDFNQYHGFSGTNPFDDPDRQLKEKIEELKDKETELNRREASLERRENEFRLVVYFT